MLVSELLDLGVQRFAERLPGPVEAREVELALAREVAVDDRLGDAHLARDVRRRRAAVGALGEDAQRPVEDRLPAFGGPQADLPERAQAATSIGVGSSLAAS